MTCFELLDCITFNFLYSYNNARKFLWTFISTIISKTDFIIHYVITIYVMILNQDSVIHELTILLEVVATYIKFSYLQKS